MNSLFSPLKAGLAGICLATGITAAASAGPLPVSAPSVPASQPQVDLVRDGWAGDAPASEEWRRWRNDRGGDWRGRDRNWRGKDWRGRDDWRWRQRPHYRGDYWGGSGVYFGLGLGVPTYRYVEPRRYYRTQRLSSAHVQWCYDRYRSYRASDNTFQPYNGPRQQCYSPYS